MKSPTLVILLALLPLLAPPLLADDQPLPRVAEKLDIDGHTTLLYAPPVDFVLAQTGKVPGAR